MAVHLIVVNTQNLWSLKDVQTLNTVVCLVWIVGDARRFRCFIWRKKKKKQLEILHALVKGRHKGWDFFTDDWAAGVDSDNACWETSHTCYCDEKAIPGVLSQFKMLVWKRAPTLTSTLPHLSSPPSRQATVYQNPWRPDWRLGRSCIICLPGLRRTKA